MSTQPDPVQSYRERLPATPLASHVSSVWVLDVAAGGAAYQHRTVPNGSVEISYALGADLVEVSGPRRQPTVARVAPGTTVVGIRFRPGAAPSVLDIPASELLEQSVELDRLWGRESLTVAERLAEAASPGEAALLLDESCASRDSSP